MAVILCGSLAGFVASPVHAEDLEEAKVSRVIQDVRLLAGNTAPRAAAINDGVRQGMAVRTGQESRAELTFTDRTISRIGENSVFSVKGGKREVQLDSGAMLLQVPHGGEPAQIRTAAVTASISGGTGLINNNKGFPTKLLVMEGEGKLCSTTSGDCEVAKGGEMIMDMNGDITKPVKFNAKLVFNTSHLLTDFPPLENEYLIVQVFTETDDGPDPSPTPDRDDVDKIDQAAAASPPPSSPPPDNGKFGPPSTITSPDPYEIDGGTVIVTDPTITTNGITDFGKIYRGRDIDGPLSAWAFGSTSSFDTTSGFDDEVGTGEDDPGGAGFKFSSLVVSDDPTIDITNGEDDLGLIAVNGIQIDAVGELNFAPINGLLFATVNGPISIGNKTSLVGMHELTFYARGATSDLTNSGLLNPERSLRIWAERDILLGGAVEAEKFFAYSGRDIIQNSSSSTAIDAAEIFMFAGRDLALIDFETSRSGPFDSSGGVDLLANHNITADIGIAISRSTSSDSSTTTPGGEVDPQMNVNINAKGNDIDISGEGGGGSPDKKIFGFLFVNLDNSFGDLAGGANININAGHDLSIGGFGILGLHVDNNSGHIGEGGNITVTTGNNLNVGDLSATISNLDGGVIDNGGNITFTIGGTLDAFNSAEFVLSSGNTDASIDSSSGGTIDIQANSINIGGSLTAEILHNGNIVPGHGRITIHSNHDITVGGDLNCWGDVSAGIPGDSAIIGNISVGGSVTTPDHLSATGSITVSSNLSAFNVFANNEVSVGNTNGSSALLVNTLDANSLSMTNISQAGPVSGNTDGSIGITPDPLTWTVASITTSGQFIPVLSSNGEDASSSFNNNPGNGGHITLNIQVDSLAIGVAGHFDHIEANGGNYNDMSSAGGNGGVVNLNVAGDVTLNDGNGAPAISATTGQFPDGGGVVPNGGLQTMGAGGVVDIQAGGTITATSTVLVSSNEVVKADAPAGFPVRRSASGGDITLASSKTSGTAISVSSSAQLLSLLNNSAPGPGGTILIKASSPGNNANNESNIIIDNTDIIVSGSNPPTEIHGAIIADRGTVEVRHEGADGTIGIADANIAADIVKVGALGTNGVLTIGGGQISADGLLKLYAPSSNGTIDFIADVTLSSQSSMSIILAANTITIQPTVEVNIIGDAGAAVVYTDHPNYNFTPGGGYTGPPPNTDNGSFTGNGAHDPQPLASAPPFDESARTARQRQTAPTTTAPVVRPAPAPVRDVNDLRVSRIRSETRLAQPPIRQ